MEENTVQIDYSDEAFEERYELAYERIAAFPGGLKGAAAEYFSAIKNISVLCNEVKVNKTKNRSINDRLYAELTDEGYSRSFLNPDYAAERFGEAGKLLCAWYLEFRGIIPFIYENRLKDVTVISETVMQLFSVFEEQASGSKETEISAEMLAELNDIVYSYMYDYAEEFIGEYTARDTDPSYSFAKDIVMNADLCDTGDDSYLYSYGEWITDEERITARLMAQLPEETVRKMAAAYVDGYIKGFAMTGKDVSRKSVVSCYLPIGFERFMRAAVTKFEEAGLKAVINRNPVHLINKRNAANIKPGFYGAANSECSFDHKEDLALLWGDKLKARKLEAIRNVYEASDELLGRQSGHACVEIFGKKGSEPVRKENAAAFNEHQLKVSREYAYKAHEISSRFMPDEETSFTIIAWPTSSIAGEASSYADEAAFEARYREIFECFVNINTLPADRWQQIQQCIADALDTAEYVDVRGSGDNETDIRIMLHKLSDPSKQTNFENCLADVNIPVGEVFTSPVLKGTNGCMHAGYVYIGGYLFRDLKICFEDGRVSDYSCGNYADPDEGRALIRRIIFKNRDRLPMGEFAVGTNTAAYAAAAKYGIADKMPVLIAEKTGPHFAVGDTCYSYEEDIVTFNPDGKQIIARENECSALRRTEPDKAYFSVHTDVTLPYDELAYIRAGGKCGTISIIENGRFVLPGTEELNKAIEEV